MKTILEIFAIFVFPVLLWYFKIVPTKYRFHGFAIMVLAGVWIIIKEDWVWQTLGIRMDNFYPALIPYLLFTFVGVMALYILAKMLGRTIVDEWNRRFYFLFGFIILSAAQEFLYRGFLIPKLSGIFNFPAVIIINTVLFSLIHVIYPQLKIDMPLIFIGGLAFAIIYIYYPNLILISLSHVILNFVATIFGFFSFYQIKKI